MKSLPRNSQETGLVVQCEGPRCSVTLALRISQTVRTVCSDDHMMLGIEPGLEA